MHPMLISPGVLYGRSQIGPINEAGEISCEGGRRSCCMAGNMEVVLPIPLAITLPVTAETSRQLGLGSDSMGQGHKTGR